MIKGTVKFYNDQKGFGFIEPEDGSKDVFVHATALERAGISGLSLLILKLTAAAARPPWQTSRSNSPHDHTSFDEINPPGGVWRVET